MKCMVAFFNILFLAITASAQPGPDTLWTRVYGDTITDHVRNVIATDDNGCVVAGPAIYELVRFDQNGDTVWTWSGLGGLTGAVAPARAGGFLLVSGGSSGSILLKFSEAGQLEWQQEYPRFGHVLDEPRHILESVDTGYILAGASDMDVFAFLMRVGPSLDTMWTRQFADWYLFDDIRERDNGDLLIAGGRRALALRATGDTLWMHESSYRYFLTLLPLPNRFSMGIAAGSDSLFFVTFGDTGGVISTVQHLSYDRSYLKRARPTADGGFIILAGLSGGPENHGFVLTRFDAAGSYLWSRSYSFQVDEVYRNSWWEDVAQTTDGGYVVVGELLTYGPTAVDSANIIVVRLEPEPSGIEFRNPVWLPDLRLSAYPNPFNPVVTLQFSIAKPGYVALNIFDLNGRLVRTLTEGQLTAGEHEFLFNGADLPSGIYFARLQAGGVAATQKLILLK